MQFCQAVVYREMRLTGRQEGNCEGPESLLFNLGFGLRLLGRHKDN